MVVDEQRYEEVVGGLVEAIALGGHFVYFGDVVVIICLDLFDFEHIVVDTQAHIDSAKLKIT